MRPISQEIYGIRARVRDRQHDLARVRRNDQGGTIVRKAELDYLDDGPGEADPDLEPESDAVHLSRAAIQTATSRCSTSPSIATAVPSPADPARRQFEREFDYTSGAERALERAERFGWTVVSIKDDWLTVF